MSFFLKAIAWHHLCDEPDVTSTHLQSLQTTCTHTPSRARKRSASTNNEHVSELTLTTVTASGSAQHADCDDSRVS